VGVRVHIRVQGPENGGESPHKGPGSQALGRESAQKSKGPTNVGKSPRKF
jgi:hypothetical protein